MLKIYVAHSKHHFDYKKELYAPLENSPLSSKYEFIFPHKTDEFVNSKEIIKESSFIIAEVSYPATSEGIELGWADSFMVPILCLYKEGGKASRSLEAISNNIVAYTDPTDMVQKIEKFLSQENHK